MLMSVFVSMLVTVVLVFVTVAMVTLVIIKVT